MNNTKMEEKGLPLWRKLGYGVGDAGANFCWTFVASFIMLYCTNTLGVSAAMVGTIMMLSKFLDGVSDILMGRIIDATHHPMGKARFWYFVSALPTALFTFLLFNVPAGFSETTKYIYIFVVYTLMGAVFYTMSNIAYSTLTALVTKNPKDRVQMGSYRFIFAIAATLLISSFTTGLVDSFGGGQQGWRMVSLVYSIICFVLLMVPVLCVKELPESELAEDTKKEKAEEPGFFKAIILLLKNKYFIMVLLIYLANYLSNGITQGMGIYFATYQMGNASLLGVLTMAGMFLIVICLPFVAKLTEKLGIRMAALAGSIVAVLGAVLLIAGGLNGIFGLVLTGLVIRAVGMAPTTGALNALIAETDEYSYLKFGQRLTGTIYSCSSMGMKIGTGIGTAACGFLLDMGGFVGTAATQTASAVATIKWSYLLSNALPVVVLVIVLSFLKVEQENREMAAQRMQEK